MTDNAEMSADAFLEYFKPLQDFLKDANQRLAKEDEVRQILAKYNVDATKQCTKLQLADWDKTTDLNNATKQQIYQKAVAENAAFAKQQYQLHFSHYNADDFSDENVRRQVTLLKRLGKDALNESDLLKLTEHIEKMVKIYNTATFCGYDKPNCSDSERLTLDPGTISVFVEKEIRNVGYLLSPIYSISVSLSLCLVFECRNHRSNGHIK